MQTRKQTTTYGRKNKIESQQLQSKPKKHNYNQTKKELDNLVEDLESLIVVVAIS